MELKIIIIVTLIILIIYVTNPCFFKKMENLLNTYTDEKFMPATSTISTTSENYKVNADMNADMNVDIDDDLKIPYRYKNATYGDNYFLDDGGDGTLGLISSFCSKSCCTDQYPLPFEMPDDKLIKNSGIKYVQTNYTCNNGFQDTGCLCMTKEQSDFLKSRGRNI